MPKYAYTTDELVYRGGPYWTLEPFPLPDQTKVYSMFPAEPRFPKALYSLVRAKWRAHGYDDSGITDLGIDGLLQGHEGDYHAQPFVVGALGDGSILRWIEAHKELIQILFRLGAMILPLLL